MDAFHRLKNEPGEETLSRQVFSVNYAYQNKPWYGRYLLLVYKDALSFSIISFKWFFTKRKAEQCYFNSKKRGRPLLLHKYGGDTLHYYTGDPFLRVW